MYIVVKCPYCGALRVAKTETVNVKCFRCEKSFRWNPKRSMSHALFSSENIKECIKYIEEHTPQPTFSNLNRYTKGETET